MELNIEHLQVSIRKAPILLDICLTVCEGELLSLLGPSGCGKSTLLKTVAGIQPMDAGRLTLGGEDISGLPAHRRGAVILFQDVRLFPHMTAAENVAFPLKMRRVPRPARMAEAEELLERVQLGGFGRRRAGELSGGQQQRVALARALAAHPRLLLLDEPFSSLDENLREDMRELVLSLHREFHVTTVLVTHDREEALSLSQRVAIMFDGQIFQCGTPDEVYHRPACRRTADYFGDCAYLPGRVSGGLFTGPHLSCPAAVPDGAYDLMLRSCALQTEQPGDFPLRVTELRFRGGDTLATLETPEGIRWKKAIPPTERLQVGQAITCRVDTARGVFFPREI